jgi:hypothetical protein
VHCYNIKFILFFAYKPGGWPTHVLSLLLLSKDKTYMQRRWRFFLAGVPKVFPNPSVSHRRSLAWLFWKARLFPSSSSSTPTHSSCRSLPLQFLSLPFPLVISTRPLMSPPYPRFLPIPPLLPLPVFSLKRGYGVLTPGKVIKITNALRLVLTYFLTPNSTQLGIEFRTKNSSKTG